MVPCIKSLSHAVKHASSRVVTPLLYTSVIYGGIVGWAVWGNIPPLINFVGIILVVIGSMFVIYYGQSNIKKKKS